MQMKASLHLNRLLRPEYILNVSNQFDECAHYLKHTWCLESNVIIKYPQKITQNKRVQTGLGLNKYIKTDCVKMTHNLNFSALVT